MGFSVAIDVLVLGTEVVPADRTILSPPNLKRNWAVTQGYGLQGAFCTYTGEGLATFDVTFDFWSEAKERLWDSWAKANLVAPKGKRPAALGVYHPVLMKPPFSIQNVQVTDLEGWSLITPGRWQTRLTLLEYRPPAPFVPAKTEPVVPPTEKVPIAKPKTELDYRIIEAKDRLAAAAAAGVRQP